MEMQQVRYFVSLCETLNFTRAAEHCNVSQPALTRAIQQLEHELGGTLFNRERNNTHLTELGRTVRPNLVEMMAHVQTAQARAADLARLRSARLKVGLARGFALGPLDGILERYLSAYPDSEVILQDERSSDLCDQLRRGDLEVAFVPHDLHDSADLHHYPIVTHHPRIVMPRNHRLVARAAVSLDDLAEQKLICVESCSFLAAAQRGRPADAVLLQPRLVTGCIDWMFELVRSGFGIGLVSTGHALSDDLVGRPLVGLDAAREVNLATKRGRRYSPPVKALVDIALRSAPCQAA